MASGPAPGPDPDLNEDLKPWKRRGKREREERKVRKPFFG